jgi:hypothetical protein
MGYPSLFVYCTDRLKLSESCAYAFISVARKSKTVPQLKEAVTRGTLNVSQAKRIVSVIAPSNAELWIENAAQYKQRELERLVARELPAPLPKEKVRAAGGDMSELKLVIPESLRKDIERLQELRGCSIIEAIGFAIGETLKRQDPVKKAIRNVSKPVPSQHSLRKAKGRTPIMAHEAHQVRVRDQGQCTHLYPNGKRCENRKWIHLHHKVPVAAGGANTAENLTSLCSQHHRILHKNDQIARPMNSRPPL